MTTRERNDKDIASTCSCLNGIPHSLAVYLPKAYVELVFIWRLLFGLFLLRILTIA